MNMDISFNLATGIFDSQLVLPGRAKSPDRTVEKYELELCLSDGGVCHIDDKKYKYTENAFICGKPGQVRYSELPYKCAFIQITADGVLKSLLDSLPDFVYLDNPEPTASLFHEIVLSEGNPSFLLGKLILLLSELIPLSEYVPIQDKTVKKAVDYIENHFDEKITLEFLSDYVSLSPIYFHNKFVKFSGVTPHQYIINCRIRHAKELLLSADLPLIDIAMKCGFSSQSYFNYIFRQQVGQTPTGYKKSMAKNYLMG